MASKQVEVSGGNSLLSDALKELSDGLEAEANAGIGIPLPGHDVPFRQWVRSVERDFDLEGLSPNHHQLIDWADNLKPGVKPPAFLAVWPRGYGKTTWLRLVALRMCVTKARKFILIVSALQASADRSVDALRQYFEDKGIERLEDRYGNSLGWRTGMLRTKCGFTVMGVGLDIASVRGLNIRGQRPDGIYPDDVDKLDETPEQTDKNYNVLTQTILAAGTTDTAVLFVQNEIHGNSIMHRVVTGEAEALRYRITSKCVAVEGLEVGTKPNPIEGEPDVWTIEAGVSTWPARDLDYWEGLLNDIGPLGFRREMQHELGAGGLFFNFYPSKAMPNINPVTGELLPGIQSIDWHVCDMPRIEDWWTVEAGGDYGTRAAHAQVIGVRDGFGVDYIVGEEYAEDRTAKQQALALLLRLEELGLSIDPVKDVVAVRDKKVAGGIRALDQDGYETPIRTRLSMFALDPAHTFAPQGRGATSAQERMTEYPEEVFRRYGIPLVRANKGIVAGLNRMREVMLATVTYPKEHPTEPGRTVPMLRLVRGAAPMAQRYLETAVKDPKDELRAVSAAKLEHIGDGLQYYVTRNGCSSDPNAYKPMYLKDGTLVSPNASPFWLAQLKPYTNLSDENRTGLGAYRRTASAGR